MTEKEIIEYYQKASNQHLIELAHDIWTIKPEFRAILFAELTARNETAAVEEAKEKLNGPNPFAEKEKNQLRYLPWFLLMFPTLLFFSIIAQLARPDEDSAANAFVVIISAISMGIYIIPVVLTFQKKYLFVWITIGQFAFWSVLFFLHTFVQEGRLDIYSGIELIGRFFILIYLINTADKARLIQRKLNSAAAPETLEK